MGRGWLNFSSLSLPQVQGISLEARRFPGRGSAYSEGLWSSFS